ISSSTTANSCICSTSNPRRTIAACALRLARSSSCTTATGASPGTSVRGVRSTSICRRSSGRRRLRPMALHYENVFRAHVAPPVGPEWTCFVEASSREAAWQKIRSLTSDDVYNLHSAATLIATGESEDPELRLFEIGWGGGLPPRFCEHPVFLLPNPGDWTRKWSAAIDREDAKTATALWRER